MRVFYRACHSSIVVYDQTRVSFCCAEMERQWDRLIGFGAKGCLRSTSRDVSLFTLHPQANGRPVLEVTPIGFCPWCGEAIEPCRMK
jgi:hypothetical protein